MDSVFKVDPEVKEEYLLTKPTGTAESDTFVLQKVDEYEQLTAKKVYNLNYTELKEMLLQFKNTSIGVVTKNVSIIRNYINYCISKNLVPHMENRLDVFTKDELRSLVSKQAMKYKYITPKELRQYCNMLANNQDKAILVAPYFGIRGRPVKGGTLEELINLQIDESSDNFRNNELKLVKNNGETRYVKVPEWAMDLLLDTKHDDIYLSNNGQDTDYAAKSKVRNITINPLGDYVFRVPGQTKRQLLTSAVINSRMRRIQNWIGNKYVTIHGLYMSGMITAAIEIYEKNGKITKQDYLSICERYDYGRKKNYEKYYLILKENVELYL